MEAHPDSKGFCHFVANTYKDLILDICYIATCFRLSFEKVDYILCCSDDPRISKLYKGLSCTEISVKTGDFCKANRGFCVLPSTRGKLESACPNQARRTIRRGKVKKHKRAKAKHVRKKGDRLVGASSLHTYRTSNPPFRYPWTCSLKTQGFRYVVTQK